METQLDKFIKNVNKRIDKLFIHVEKFKERITGDIGTIEIEIAQLTKAILLLEGLLKIESGKRRKGDDR